MAARRKRLIAGRAGGIRRPGVSEWHHCVEFVDWTRLVTYRGESLFERVVHIPNERGGGGKAHIGTLIRAGFRVGFPDYSILAPLGDWAGLYLEAKKPGGAIYADQVAWRDRLIRYGYRAVICDDAAALIAATREYFAELGPPEWIDRVQA